MRRKASTATLRAPGSGSLTSRGFARAARPAALGALAAVVFLLGLAPLGLAEDQALLLSVSRHRNDLWALDMARTNAAMFEERLREDVGIAEENIQVLRDQDVNRLVVKKALERLAVDAGKGDRLFLYYTGHGTKVLAAGAPLRAYFTYETERKRWGGEGYDPDTLILDSDLASWVAPWRKAGGLVIFLREACFTGGGYSQDIGRASPGRPPEDLHVGDLEFSACDVDEAAWPRPGIAPRRGVFTDALCEALSAPDSRLTAAEVFAGIRSRVRGWEEDVHRQSPAFFAGPRLDRTVLVDRTIVEVSLTVLDAVTREPIPHARVFPGAEGGTAVDAGADGLAKLGRVARPAGGTLYPWVEAEGYVPLSASLDLSPRERRVAGRVFLEPQVARVRGRLRVSGGPLSRFEVGYESDGEAADPRHVSRRVSPAADGSFELRVPAGAPCRVVVIAAGRVVARADVEGGAPLDPARRWDGSRRRFVEKVHDLPGPIDVAAPDGPAGPTEAERTFDRWYGEGDRAEAAGDLEKALDGYRTALDAAGLVGTEQRKAELSSRAREAIERVQGVLDHRHYEKLCDEANGLLDRGRMAEAKRSIQAALGLEPRGPRATVLKGRLDRMVAAARDAEAQRKAAEEQRKAAGAREAAGRTGVPAGADAGGRGARRATPTGTLPPGFLDRFEILDDSRPYRDGRKGLANGEWAPCDLPVEVRHKKSGIVMRLVPPGWFWMGVSPGDDLADGDEKPRHRVTITKPFYLGKTEVTWEEWERNRGSLPRPDRPEWASDDRMPVVNVSWEDCKSFCDRLGLRLPSEAEWEYAARAGVASRWPWGDDPDRGAGYANVADLAFKREYSNSTVAGFDDGYVETAPAGSFRPSALGLHDMTGNVWEWCLDWYDSDVYGRHGGGVEDPRGPSSGSGRVLRGGSWFYFPRVTRLSVRDRCVPSVRIVIVGCRVASDP